MAARRCPRACCGLSSSLRLLKSPLSCGSAAYGHSPSDVASRGVVHARYYVPPRAPRSGPSHADVFHMKDIPRACFESVISRNGNSFRRLSPEEYYDCALRFSEAVSKGSSPWAVSLGCKGLFSASVLHDVACIMRQVPSQKNSDALATAMWASASAMGYRPSTLSLARQLIRSGAYGRLPPLKVVESRFKRLASTGKDPDALTAEGELLYEQGKVDAAVTTLQRALRIPCSSFEWKPHCELCLGKAFLKLGRHEEARSLFEALSGSGMVEADAELGMMLKDSERERAEQRLYTAACNGRRDMFSLLAETALDGAASKTDVGCIEDGRRWAMEWARLADSQVEY